MSDTQKIEILREIVNLDSDSLGALRFASHAYRAGYDAGAADAERRCSDVPVAVEST